MQKGHDNIGYRTGYLVPHSNKEREPIYRGKVDPHDPQDIRLQDTSPKKSGELGEPYEYMGDRYQDQEKCRSSGPCKRVASNKQKPYKTGGGIELFEEDTLKGDMDTGGKAVEMQIMDRQLRPQLRPYSAPVKKSNRPAWNSPAGNTYKDFRGKEKMHATQQSREGEYEDKWRRSYRYKRTSLQQRPFTAGFHGRTLAATGPYGNPDGGATGSCTNR